MRQRTAPPRMPAAASTTVPHAAGPAVARKVVRKAFKRKQPTTTATKSRACPPPSPSQWDALLHPSLLAEAVRRMRSIHPDIEAPTAVSRPSSLGLRTNAVSVRFPKSIHACPIRKQPHKRNNANVIVVGKTPEALLLPDEGQGNRDGEVQFWYHCFDRDCANVVKARPVKTNPRAPFASSLLLDCDASTGKAVVVLPE